MKNENIEYFKGTFSFHPKFKKEYEKIIKKHKCPTLENDLELLKKVLYKTITNNKNHIFPNNICTRISGLNRNVPYPAFIIKNFRCKGINKGKKSGFRITFIFYTDTNKFCFVEIFHKNEKDIEDKNRINKMFM